MTVVKIEGLEQALKNIKRLEDSVKGKAIRDGLDLAGQLVKQDAHDKCPVKGGTSADGYYTSPGTPTAQSGAVRRSIDYRVEGDTATVYTNHLIAKPLELGTSRESPHPFMRRSVDDPSTQKAVAERFKAAIIDAIRRVV